jgi:hypothetical protein
LARQTALLADRPVEVPLDLGQGLAQPAQVGVDPPVQGRLGGVPPVALGDQHLEQLAPARHQAPEVPGGLVGQGRTGGRTASAKRAITAASRRSVLASRPVARAKARTWRGLTTATGRPAAARAAAGRTSIPPVASSTTSAGASAARRSTSAATPRSSWSIVKRSPEGRRWMSRLCLATSMPTNAGAGAVALSMTRFRWMRAVEPW